MTRKKLIQILRDAMKSAINFKSDSIDIDQKINSEAEKIADNHYPKRCKNCQYFKNETTNLGNCQHPQNLNEIVSKNSFCMLFKSK